MPGLKRPWAIQRQHVTEDGIKYWVTMRGRYAYRRRAVGVVLTELDFFHHRASVKPEFRVVHSVTGAVHTVTVRGIES